MGVTTLLVNLGATAVRFHTTFQLGDCHITIQQLVVWMLWSNTKQQLIRQASIQFGITIPIWDLVDLEWSHETSG